MGYEIKGRLHKEQNFVSKYLPGCCGAVVLLLSQNRAEQWRLLLPRERIPPGGSVGHAELGAHSSVASV